jgi:hypothetical protein
MQRFAILTDVRFYSGGFYSRDTSDSENSERFMIC